MNATSGRPSWSPPRPGVIGVCGRSLGDQDGYRYISAPKEVGGSNFSSKFSKSDSLDKISPGREPRRSRARRERGCSRSTWKTNPAKMLPEDITWKSSLG